MVIEPESSITGSIRYRARRDLQLTLVSDGKENRRFNLLDPVTRQSYRIGLLERTLLELFDGRRTLSQVQQILRSEPDFKGLHDSQLIELIARLQRSGLITSTEPTTHSTRPVERSSRLSSLVVWQIRGFEPDAFLNNLAPHTNLLFSKLACKVWMCSAVFTLGLVLLDFPRLLSQATNWNWIVQPAQGTTLFVVFLATRAIHELGHALVCKRHGVRCPDIGLFVILGAPCVYCDVSESWKLPSRWQRMAVAAAGMYVEIIVATLAAWVWMLTLDGNVNLLALQTMFVCSVSTLLINANPLMRFDGYYIISDLLNDPNLRARADAIATGHLFRWMLGKRLVNESKACFSWPNLGLLVFSWAGWFYRAAMSLAMAALLVSLYEYWNLAWLGRIIAIVILFSWWGVPSMKFAQEIVRTAQQTRTGWRLAFVSAALVAAIALIPIPRREFATGWVQPVKLQGVYVSRAGRLAEQLVQELTQVEVQQPLFRMSSLEVEREAIRLQGAEEVAQIQLATYRQTSLHQDTKSIDLAPYEAILQTAREQSERATHEVRQMTLRAPCSGRLLVMPANDARGPDSDFKGPIQDWDSPNQIGRLVPQGTMLAAVCSDERLAIVPLRDQQLEWIATGTRVRLCSATDSSSVFDSAVQAVVSLREIDATWRLMHELQTSGDDQATARRTDATYAALVPLPEDTSAVVGASVSATFVAPAQSLATIGQRWLKQNLRWLAD
jgi:putative peptide zinc metalloprotease protein